MQFILSWFVATLAFLVAAYLIPGVTIDSLAAAFVAALVLGCINAFIKPLLIFLTLPITIVTFGLFLLVINAAIILLIAAIVPGFHVNGFWWAVLFSIIVSVLMSVLNQIAYT